MSEQSLAFWAMSHAGIIQAEYLAERLTKAPWQGIDRARIFAPQSLCARWPNIQASAIANLRSGMALYFKSFRGHIIFGACGLAVRLIAPHIEDKRSDPAVLVIDSQGHFVISLLSGHLGYANELTSHVAHILGATPVITTASDQNKVPALDILFRESHCTVLDWDEMPRMQALLLEDARPYLYDPFQLLTDLPCTVAQSPTVPGIALHVQKSAKKAGLLRVVPPAVLGIGCKKNCDPACVAQAATLFFEKNAIDQRALVAVASVTEKAHEQAILDLAAKLGIPFCTKEAATLSKIKTRNPSHAAGKRFATEDFSVCEAAACAILSDFLCANTAAALFLQKERFFSQVTLALSVPVAKSNG